MNFLFIGLAALLAVVDWWAVASSRRRIEWIAKPAVILTLILYVCLAMLQSKKGFFDIGGLEFGILPFLIGLIFSLLGDVLLMLPHERFSGGVLAFMLAHLAYIAGFNPIPPAKIQHIFVAGVVILLISLPASQMHRRLMAAMEASKHPRLKVLITLYTLTISLMFASALFTMIRGGWQPFAALAAAAGAAAFLLSDALLAWNRFIAPLRFDRLANTIPYHIGQILIIAGAVMQFSTNPA